MVHLSYNKKGTVLFLLMIGIIFFVLGLALTPALTEVSNESMSTAELNCSSPSISEQDKANCTSIDILPFLYFGVMFGLAGLALAGATLR